MASRSMALNRVKREVAEVKKDPQIKESSIELWAPDESDLVHLMGRVVGPPDTPYAGGVYTLSIEIPDSYPFKPPKVKFVNKIWHPNVSSQTGAICLDILKDQWAAAMTLRTVLLSIQALMSAAEPDDPQDAVVATQYKKDRAMFERTASHWARAYAEAPAPTVVKHGAKYDEEVAMITQVVDMGVGDAQARDALSSSGWSLEAALQKIFS